MLPNNQNYQSPQLVKVPLLSYRCLEVVKEEEPEDEQRKVNENFTETQSRMLTAYTTPMKGVKRQQGSSSSSGRSPFQELNKSSSNQKVLTHVTPNKNSVLKFR